jgi:hypothetical protein
MSELMAAIEFIEAQKTKAEQTVADCEAALRVLRPMRNGAEMSAPEIAPKKKRGPCKVTVRRKKDLALVAELESNEDQDHPSRKDILLAVKFQARTLGDLAAQAQITRELALYHCKKLIAAGKLATTEIRGETVYQLPNA